MRKVTVGLPVYNEGAVLEKTLENILSSAEVIDKVIVSDNCSTDDTGDICRRFAKKYSNIIYTRQSKPVSQFENFRQVLKSANSEYFMFWRAKNFADEGYISKCYEILEDSPEAILVFSDLVPFNDGFTKSDLLNMCICSPDADVLYSDDIKSKARLISENPMIRCVVYQFCRTSALMKVWDQLECVNFFDEILALRLGLLGKWVKIDGLRYFHYIRKNETPEQRKKRYEQAGFLQSEINPNKLLVREFIRICYDNNIVMDETFRQDIIRNFRWNDGAEWNNEDWILRHENGKMIDRIKRLSEGKEVFFFGAGEDGKKIYEKVKNKLPVVGFIDNDKSKQNMYCNGIKIYSVDILARYKEAIICITSGKYFREMMQIMEKFGYVYDKNLFCLHEIEYENL